jgi:predicted CopG family antitoxin
MPREGYESITVSQEVYLRLKKEADEDNRPISNYVVNLLKEYWKQQEAQKQATPEAA